MKVKLFETTDTLKAIIAIPANVGFDGPIEAIEINATL